jgi:hypothetical protein
MAAQSETISDSLFSVEAALEGADWPTTFEHAEAGAE